MENAMFEEYKYKIELHAHTSPASPCGKVSPEELVERFKKYNYNSIAITNHFMYSENEDEQKKITGYLDDFHRAAKAGEKAGINIILGAEIRFAENNNDYLLYGFEEDELYKINSLLKFGIDNFYRQFKNDKNIIIQAHPFRDGMFRANPESVDGVEVFNMHPHHNSRVALAARYAREHSLLATAGTDFHDPGYEGLCATMSKTPIRSASDIVELIKSQDFKIDISGYIISL